MTKLLYWNLIFPIVVVAMSTDLNQVKQELPVNPLINLKLELPTFAIKQANYKMPEYNDIFNSGRNESFVQNVQVYNDNFSLSDLQMVGYIYYKKINYALLKTPFAVIKVKPGDQIKNAQVMLINQNSVEIYESQTIHNKIYIKKIYLNMIPPKNS